jgi:hypothetical protein
VAVTSLDPDRGTEQRLASVVDELRAERDGLREAMRTRALIEQAKGILMGRHRISADEAFARLRRVSQRTNVRLTEVAASVVARASPPLRSGGAPLAADVGQASPLPASCDAARPAGPPRERPTATTPRPTAVTAPAARAPHPGAGAPRRPGTGGDPEHAVLHAQHLLLAARLEVATSHHEIVAAVADLSFGWPSPNSVVLALVEPDSALAVVATHGLSTDMASQWTRIPPQVDVPLTAAVRSRSPIWLADPDQIRASYRVVGAMAPYVGACVSLPIEAGGLPGVLGLTWKPALDLDEARRSYLTTVADLAGKAVARLAAAVPDVDPHLSPDRPAPSAIAAPPWIQPMLDGSLAPAVLLSPLRTGGVVTDFMFEHVNGAAADEAARRGKRLPGTTLLTTAPDVGARTLMPLYLEVLGDGRPRQLDNVRLPPSRPDDPGARCTVRAVRLGDRILATWRLRSPAEAIYEDMVAAERVARIAAFRWHLSTGELIGSPNLRSVLDWPAGTPLRAATASTAVDPQHWSATRAALVGTLRTGVPLTVTVLTRKRHRWLRVTGERLTDSSGRPTALRGCVQDLSQLRSVQPHPHRLSRAPAANRRDAPKAI